MSDAANPPTLIKAVIVATIDGREAKIVAGVRGLDAPLPLADLARACFDAIAVTGAPTGTFADRPAPASPIVCAFEEGSIAMTPELWAAAIEQCACLGRPLTSDELRQLADVATAPGAGFSVEGEPFSWFADPHRSPATPDPIADAGDASRRAAARTWEAALSFRTVPGK